MNAPIATRSITVAGLELNLSGIQGDGYFEGVSANAEGDFVRFITEFLPERGRFLDIGANIGLTSLIAATLKPECSIIAVEAAPQIAQITRQNLVQNSVRNFELHNVAAGPAEGQVTFLEHSAYGHVVKGGDVSRAGLPHATISVPVRTIDSVVGERAIDAIKIDVEGFEESVLEGIIEIEARCRPAYFIEFNAWALSAFGRVNPMDFMERMLGRFAYISYMNKAGAWTKVDALSCIHVVYLGFQEQVTNLVCSNDPAKVLL